MAMRIGIDVRYLSHGLVGGVHTYIATFIPELIKISDGRQIYLYADTKAPFELADLPQWVTVRYFPWKNALSSIYHDFFMRRYLEDDRLDVIHFPANYGFGPAGIRKVVTLHDEINILPLPKIIRGHPKNLKTMALMTYLHFCSRMSLLHTDLIITVSEYARRQIAKVGRVDPDRIVSVHHAPTPDLRRIQDESILSSVRRRYSLSRPFILADGLKNPGVLIRAWRQLPDSVKEQWQQVFFARRADVLPVLQDAVSNGEAVLLVNPPREDLIALFSQAQIFVFPSWIEGFGIPVLEAMKCGAPVIASNRGSLPEVVGEAGLMIDAEDDAALSEFIFELFQSEGQRSHLRQLGFRRASQFSWQRAARQILDCYEKVVHTSTESK
jgi:glycosyltransferase involved in cell wall biosynthesis